MVVYTDKVVLELEAKLASYHADILKGQQRFDTAMDKMSKGLKNVESQSVLTFSRMTTALSAIGGALGVAEIIRYADAWTRAQNSLAVAGLTGETQKRILDELYQSAQRNSTPINALTELYGRAAQASDILGASQAELVQFSDGVAVALRVAGTDAVAASGALLQLGQALGNSKVQAEEFNSINEGARPILMAVAAGIESTGGSVSNLRKMMLAGNLTSKEFFEGFIRGMPAIQEMADRTTSTVAQGFTRISNAVTKYIGEMNEGTGGTRVLIGVLELLGNNFAQVANTALILSGIMLSRYVPALIATAAAQAAVIATNPFAALAVAISLAAGYLATFSDEIKVFNDDFANLGDYAAEAMEFLGTAAENAGDVVMDAFNGMVDFVTDALDGIGVKWEDVTGFILAAVNKTIGSIRAINGVAEAVLVALPSVVADAAISAMQLMVDIIQEGLNKVVRAMNTVIRGLKSIPGLGSQIGDEFGEIDLGQIPNPAAGATYKLGNDISDIIDEAMNRDYVGEGVEAAEGFFKGWRQGANERAAKRAVGDMNDLLLGDGEEGMPPPPGSTEDEKKKKGGKGKKGYDFAEELRELQLRTAAITAETEALAQLDPLAEDYETQVTRIKTEQELLNKAAKDGIQLSPAQREAIRAMSAAYAEADEQARKLRETQTDAQQKQKEWVDTQKDAMKGFIKDLASGKDAMEALGDAVGKLADKLLDMAVDGLFDNWGKGGGGGGFWSSIWSGISGIFGGKRANGGSAEAGRPYLINENTPNSEIFVPSRNGAVLNVPQAQAALSRAARASSRFGSGTQVSGAGAGMIRTENNFTFSLEGANGDKAIEDAVNRGIRAAAPLIKNSAVEDAAKLVGKQSRTGSKSFLGIR